VDEEEKEKAACTLAGCEPHEQIKKGRISQKKNQKISHMLEAYLGAQIAIV